MNDIDFWEKVLKLCSTFMLVLQGLIYVFAFLNRRYFNNKSIRFILIYSLLSFCLSLLEFVLLKFILVRDFIYFSEIYTFFINLGIVDFNFISPFSYLIKFIFLGLFFRDIFEAKNLKILFQVLIFALVIFELIMVFVFKSYQGYDSISSTVKNIFLMLGSGFFLFKFYNKDNSSLKLQKNPYFWLGIGLFVPALTDLFLEFIFSKLYQTDTADFYKYYLYRNASQILGFLLLIKGFWQSKYLNFLPSKY